MPYSFVPMTSIDYTLKYWSLYVQWFMKKLKQEQRRMASLISVMLLSKEDSIWNHNSALTSFVSFNETLDFCFFLFVYHKVWVVHNLGYYNLSRNFLFGSMMVALFPLLEGTVQGSYSSNVFDRLCPESFSSWNCSYYLFWQYCEVFF